MNDILPLSLTLVIAFIAVARITQLIVSWPPTGARLWPWLRLQPWWPVSAEHTAEVLLRSTLSSDEYRQLLSRSFVDVPSRTYAGRVYRIPRGPGQVLVLEDNRVVERLCVQPIEYLPEADVILLHKLLIEGDERTYLETANHFARASWR